ncbi:hypothetical protein PoB_000306200 [Plakobranchus ocellatus]|uniref:Uncharacterized protein n=1 Tax=Plakobranchus ocellatus TaxID=259542 RepID=A0AAV3Y2A3_9GAST|nr:hypothetical protein PoB_000306200 [Plakobranchus ocellatus]
MGRVVRNQTNLRGSEGLVRQEKFMDAYPEDLSVYIRKKVPRDLENVGKEADLYLIAHKRNLCDQAPRSTKTGARSVKDSVWPREPERKVGGGQLAWELKTSTNNQCSCFKCKI